METIIVSVILVLIIGGAALYVYRAKKRGVKCIGCPNGAECGGRCCGDCGSCSGCSGYSERK